MTQEKRTSAHRWMRILHRDIGFFVVGLTIIYCISGIMLTLRTTDFLKSETLIEKTIDAGLSAGQLNRALHLKEMKLKFAGCRHILVQCPKKYCVISGQ